MSLLKTSKPGYETYLTNTIGIGGKLRKSPDDFRVTEFIENKKTSHWNWIKANENGRHCIVKITCKNWDTHILVKEIAKQLRISERAIGFAGTKDKRSVSTQYFSLMASSERINKIEINNVDIRIKHRTTKPIRLGNLVGNKFNIKITDVSGCKKKISETLKKLERSFPNYFGIQRFGVARPITHLVGEKIVRGKFREAVWIYLTEGGENIAGAEARARLKSEKDWESALQFFPINLVFERQMIRHLMKNKDDYSGAIKRLPENLSKMLVHSYQSLMFNKMVEERIKKGISMKYPVVGDSIMPMDIYGGPDQRKPIEVTKNNLKKLRKRCDEGKAWIAGILPGAKSNFSKGIQGEIEEKIMNDERMKFEDFIIEEIPELSSKGMYRPLMQNLNDLKVNYDKDGLPTFSFWLHKGTYATSFLREIMKSEDLKAY